jgi:hypothetical protein
MSAHIWSIWTHVLTDFLPTVFDVLISSFLLPWPTILLVSWVHCQLADSWLGVLLFPVAYNKCWMQYYSCSFTKATTSSPVVRMLTEEWWQNHCFILTSACLFEWVHFMFAMDIAHILHPSHARLPIQVTKGAISHVDLQIW